MIFKSAFTFHKKCLGMGNHKLVSEEKIALPQIFT